MPERGEHAETICIGDIEITPGEGLVRAAGHVLTLSVREFQLLLAMVEHAGGIVAREELCRVVWGRELRTGDRSVDVYVSKLRSKLEASAPGRRYIHTHPSFGYRFQPQTAPAGDLNRARLQAPAPAIDDGDRESTTGRIVG
jgi:DNA-binding response OmpR family regulator